MENTNIEKPQVTLTGENGNVFNLIAICSRAVLGQEVMMRPFKS